MKTHSVLALLVAAVVATGGCDAGRGAASPTWEASAAWRSATVLQPDAGRFEVAARRDGIVVGDKTAWVELEDGWMPVDTPDGSPHDGLVAFRRGLVAWAEGGRIRTSRDGLEWTDAVVGPGEANVAAILPFGDNLVMLGEGIRQRIGAWISRDGPTWSPLSDAPLGMFAGTEVPGRGLVGVGWSGPDAAAWTTTDGARWRAFPPPASIGGSAMIGVAAAAGTVVAIGHAGGTTAAWRSDDLETWTESVVSAANDVSVRAIAHMNGSFVITGQRDRKPTLWLSADGRSWSTIALPVAPGTDGTTVAIRGTHGRFIVFGHETQDMHNGGDWPVAHLVWTLELPD